MLKRILVFVSIMLISMAISGCGVVDAFKPQTSTSENDIVVPQNTLSVVYVPTTGVSSTPPAYADFNSSSLPATVIEAKVITYPTHGNLVFSSNMAIYRPTPGYLGADYYSFEVYSTYDDEITTYKINLTVVEGSAIPFISGSPAGSVKVGSNYSFTPTIVNRGASQYYFSVGGAPSWMRIDVNSGRLSGVPGEEDIGVADGISLTATDGVSSLSLPAFSVTVNAKPTTSTPNNSTNTPPTISGVPSTQAFDGVLYSFTPVASDTDGDSLSFGIANKPTWASFSTGTGQLNGTPSAADINTTSSNISIYVSDGTTTTSLPTFSIEVQ